MNYKRWNAHEMMSRMIHSECAARDINKNMKHSPNIHVLLINNGDYLLNRTQLCYDPIREKVPDVIKKLIKTYKNEHIVAVFYGKTVRPVCPVIPIEDSTDSIIYNIIQIEFDYDENVTKDMLMDAFKTRSIISKPEFGFLVKYDKLFIHEVE